MDNFLFLPRAATSALFDIAFTAAFGCGLARLWLGSGGLAAVVQALRRTLILCAFAMIALLLVQAWLVTATMLGTSAFQEVRGQLWDVLSGTHAGRTLIPQLGLAVALLVVASPGRAWAGRAGISIPLLLLGALACVRSASGHAAAQGDFTFAVGLEFVHLVSIATWAGGIAIAGLILLPGLLRRDDLQNRLQETTRCAASLSRTSTWAVCLVIATGLLKGWIGLGQSLRPLEHTQWGILLTVKSALVMLALALGVKNRLTLGRNAVLAEADATSFSRWVKAEALLMVVILALSGFLANSPPAID
jgi:putative copper resistance protein D